MPTYEYKCDNCGHEFEKFQSITASAIKKCPECGKMKVRRLIGTGAGIIFKGSGFYQTDYRSSGYKADASKDSKPASSSSSSSESKSDSKSAKSSDSKPAKAAAKSDK